MIHAVPEIRLHLQAIMTKVSDVIASCNQGTECLCNGNYDTAIDSLHQGLTMLKEIMFSSTEVKTQPKATFLTYQFVGNHDNNSEGPGLDIVEFFVFQKPIFIQHQASEGQNAGTECSSKISFILLYNLALAHHLKARALKQTTDLARALAFYIAAYKIQKLECFSLTGLEVIAMLNNMGQIYNFFQEETSSRFCLESLVSNVMLLRERGCVIEEYEGFIASVQPLILTDPCIAGAA